MLNLSRNVGFYQYILNQSIGWVEQEAHKRKGRKNVKLGEGIFVGFTAIFANKMRSLLTMLGIVIGVAAVLAMIAIGDGAKLMVLQNLENLGEGGPTTSVCTEILGLKKDYKTINIVGYNSLLYLIKVKKGL